MGKVYIHTLILFFCALFSFQVNASHIMGGEITWECQANGQYIFTLKVYRDCNSTVGIGNNQNLELHNYPNPGNSYVDINLNHISTTNLSANCNAGGGCAAQEYVFESAPITLNGTPGPAGWIFTWTDGNRNTAIDNISNAGNYGITLRAKMFAFNGQNANTCFDSSPEFAEIPSVIICSDFEYTYNHNATDNELDDLVYEWAKPLNGSTSGSLGGLFVEGSYPTYVPFYTAIGYSYTSPFPGTTQDPLNIPAVLDPATGEITYTSYTRGEYVSVIKVSAYRCGQKIAEIYREIQIKITNNCGTNAPPEMDAPFQDPNGLYTRFRDTVVAGELVTFTLNASDPDNDPITVSASGDQFGNNFTDPNVGCANPPCAILSNTLPATANGSYTTQFSWQTDCNHIAKQTSGCSTSQNTHSFIFKVADDNCPTPGQKLMTVAITIIADTVLENPEIICADVGANGEVELTWDTISDPTASFKKWMIYRSTDRNGPYLPIDSIADFNQTSYTDSSASADIQSNHYIVRTKSSCHDAWLLKEPDTISSIYVNAQLNADCINVSWNPLDFPNPNGSSPTYDVYREYPAGSGFLLYKSMSGTSFCDTFNVCTDSVSYRVELSNSGNVCSGSSSNTKGILFHFPEPLADFINSNNCGLDVQFTDNTILSSGTISTYSWDFGDGSAKSTSANPLHTFPSAGTYKVVLAVTSNKFCQDTISKMVSLNMPFADAGSDTTICEGNSVVIGGKPTSISANVTYSWSPVASIVNPTAANPTVNPTVSTEYFVTVTNINGCSNLDSMMVFVDSLPNIDAGADKQICIGDSVIIGGNPTSTTGNVSFSWSPTTGLNNPNIANPTAFPTSTSIYTLTVTSQEGCSITQTVNVVVNPLPIADAGADLIICDGETIVIGGNSSSGAGTTYLWMPSLDLSDPTLENPIADPSATTSYTIQVTDVNSCYAEDEMILTVNPAVTVDAGVDVALCKENLPFILNGSVSVATGGTWIGGNGTFSQGRNSLTGFYFPTSNEISTGSVQLILESTGNGICPLKRDTVVFTIVPFDGSININKTDVSCFGQADGSITAQVVGLDGPYSFNWNINGNVVAGNSVGNLAPGSYSLTITNDFGCDSIVVVNITQPVKLIPSATVNNNVSCFGGSDASASVSASGGTSPYTYRWSDNQSTAMASNLSAGKYLVTITDANNCTAVDSVMVTEPSQLITSISFQKNVSCFGGNDATATVSATGGSFPYTYLWSNNQTTAQATGLSAGTYSVTVSDANRCSTVSSVSISQPSQLASITTVQNSASCFGNNNASAYVTAFGGTTPYTYSWSNSQTSDTLRNVAAGKYYVTITDAKGCSKVDSVLLNEPAVLTATISNQNNVSCFGGSNGTASVSVSGGTLPYSYLWSNSQTTRVATNLSAGTHSVSVTDANGCTHSISVTLTQPSKLIPATLVNSNVSCFGGSDASASVSATGGTSPYTYKWSDNQSTATAINLSAGKYFVTVTDANNCTALDSVMVTEPSQLIASISFQKNVSCFGGNDATATVTATGGTFPYIYLWSNNQTNATATGLSSGTYSVTVTDSKGCTKISSVSISQPTKLLSMTTAQSSASCFGNSDASAFVTAFGGTAPYTYSWSNSQTSDTLRNVAAGKYYVTITDAKGCSKVDSVTLVEPAVLSATISNKNNISCFGGSNGTASVSVSGGTLPYSYLWSNNQTTRVATNLSAGTHSVSVTDANGCTYSISVTLTQPSKLIPATVVNNNVSCFGGSYASASVSATGGTSPYTYKWSDNQSTATATNLSAGKYFVTITDANNCTAVDSVMVTEPSQLIASISFQKNVSCFGGNDATATVTATGGTFPYIYLWSNNQTNATATGLSSGTYSVTVTDSKGCSKISSVSISQPTKLLSMTTAQSSASCFGNSDASAFVTAFGGTAPYTYSWSNSQTSDTLRNVAAGKYYVSITDAKGCSKVDSDLLNEPAVLTATISNQNNVSCFGGSNGTASVSVSGGTLPYSYLWSNSQTTRVANNLSAGTHTVSVTDANGCTHSISVTLTQPSKLIPATVVNNNVSCFGGSDASASVSASGGTSPYTYKWSDNQSTATATNLSAGKYFVTLTDANNCTALDSVMVTEPSQLIASISFQKNESCFGGNDAIATVSATGGTFPYSYLWSNNQTTATATGLSAGTYSVTVTDSKGCSKISSVSISQPSKLLSMTTAQNSASCFGNSDASAFVTAFGGTAPYTYSWSNSQTSDTLRNVAAGKYYVTITDAKGCSKVDSVLLNEPAVLTATISNQNNISCFGGSNGTASVSVSGGTLPYSYLWSNNQTTRVANNLSAGTHSVSVTDANGCTHSISVTLTQPSKLIPATVVNNNVSCFGGSDASASVSASGGTSPYTYKWSDNQSTATAINLSAGKYFVTLTDANNCTALDSVMVTEPSQLIASISFQKNVSCFGGNDATATVSATGGTFPYTYLWSNNQTTATATALSAGTYSVTVTDYKGCTKISSVSISQPSKLLSMTTAQNSASCFGNSDASAFVTAFGGTTPYTYSWSNSQTSDTLRNVAAGKYYVTITDAKGCSKVDSVLLNEPAVLSATISNTNNISCFGGSDGTASVSVSGGTLPYSYLWSNNQTTRVATNLSAGTHSISVTDANGCTHSISVTLTQPSKLIPTTVVNSNVSCFGGSDASASVSASGGTSPYTYKWSDNQSTSTATNLSAGKYFVTLTDANNCTAVDSVMVTEPSQLIASISFQKNVSCFGGNDATATVSATGGTFPYVYLWSNNQTTATATALSAGTYSVTVTDSKGCTKISSVSISQPSQLASITTAQNSASCFGNSDASAYVTAFGGTAPYTYSWSNSQTSDTLRNVAAGKYYVTITDAKGCSKVDSVLLNEPVVLTATISNQNNVSCFGGSNGTASVSVSGGTLPYSYLWSNNQTTRVATNLSAGTHSVSVTDANGCTHSISLTLTQPSKLIPATVVNNNVSCFAGSDASASVSASGGTSPYTYKWSDNQSTATAINLSAGKYFVTITDANNCTAVDSVSITEPSAITVTTIVNDISCYGAADGTATVSVNGGVAPYQYSWSNGNNGPTSDSLSPGVYQITVTDNNSCSKLISISINQPSPLQLTLNGSHMSCFGIEDGSISASVSGGVAPYQYLWSNNSTTSTINGLSEGIYSVIVSDANQCSISADFTITEPQKITLHLSASDTICINEPKVLQALVNGGNGDYSFEWNHGLPDAPTVTVNPENTSLFTVKVKDSNGCGNVSDSSTIYVRNINNSEISLTSSGNICLNDTATITGFHQGEFSQYSYSWNKGFFGLGPHKVSPKTDTKYILTVTDICNNQISDSVIVKVHELPKINLDDTIASGCEPLEVNFNNNTSIRMNYFWDFGDGTTSNAVNPIHTFGVGVYNVNLVVESNQGCISESKKQHKIYVKPSPDAEFTADPLVTNIDSPFVSAHSITISDATDWTWNFGDGTTYKERSPEHTYQDTGTYFIELFEINDFGCSMTNTVKIRIHPVFEIEIPTAFTPNTNGPSDGRYNKNSYNNDVFYPFTEYIESFDMKIYNRWGELIFESNDLEIGWDGYYQGELCQQDMYIYKIHLVYTDGTVVDKAGDITLLR